MRISDFTGRPWFICLVSCGLILVLMAPAATVVAPLGRPLVVGVFVIAVAAGSALIASAPLIGWLLVIVDRSRMRERDERFKDLARRRSLDVRLSRPRRKHSALPFVGAQDFHDYRRALSRDLSTEIGSFTAEYPRGVRASKTRTWSYLRVRLAAPVPHIIVDLKANDSFFRSSLPVDLASAQRLVPEGDFWRSFTMYCPVGYETDALYLFTPDILVRLLDHIEDVDLEMVGDQLFLYDRRRWDLGDVDRWRIIDTLLAEVCAPLTRRSQLYADEKTKPNRLRLAPSSVPSRPADGPAAHRRVAPAGRRLAVARPTVIANIGLAAVGVGLFALVLFMEGLGL